MYLFPLMEQRSWQNSGEVFSACVFTPGSRSEARRGELTTVCFARLDRELIAYGLDEWGPKAGMVSACLSDVIMPLECLCIGFQ